MKTVVNLLVTCGLAAVSIFVMMYIPTAIDFSNVIVRLEDNDTIYRFLIYLPLILSMFNGVLTLINAFTKNTTVLVMNIIISLGIAAYLFVDVMGSVSAIETIGQKLNYVEYANIGCAVLLIGELIYSIITRKKINH